MTAFRDASPTATHPAGMPFPPTNQLRGQTTMRTKLPPQPSPFDADFVDEACSRYEMPPIDPDRLAIEVDCAELDLYLPFAGLGFDIPDLTWEPVEGTRDWTRPFTRRPWVDVGLRFGGAAEDGLNSFAGVLDFYKPGGPGERLPDGSRRLPCNQMPRPEHAWLLTMGRAVFLPGTEEPWVPAADLRAVLALLRDGAIDPRELVSPLVLRAWLEHPRSAPRPYRRPRPSGDVTRAHVKLRTLAPAMGALLGWDDDDMAAAAPAKEANALARRVLGIRVDLRVGGLMDPVDIEIATEIVAHRRMVGDERLESRLYPHLRANLPRVRAPEQIGAPNLPDGAAWAGAVSQLVDEPDVPGCPQVPDDASCMLDGAAWSCDLARLMSDPEIWGIAPPRRRVRPARAPTTVGIDVEWPLP